MMPRVGAFSPVRGAARLFLSTVVMLTLVFAGLAWLAWQERQVALQAHLDKQSELQRIAMVGLRDDTEELAILSASLLASDPEIARLVRQAARHYAVNAEGAVELNRDREQLRRQLAARWVALQGRGVSQVNVHLGPDALTLVRVDRDHPLGEHGGPRSMGMHAIAKEEAVSGIDIGQRRLSMRAVAPIHADAQEDAEVVGVVEVGINLFASLQQLETQIGQNMEAAETGIALLVNRDRAELLHAEQRDSLEAGSEHWLLRAGADPRAREWLKAGLLPAPGDGVQQHLLAMDDGRFLLTLLPLNDTEAEDGAPPALALAVWSSISDVLTVQWRQDLRIALLWGGAWLVTVALVLALFSLMRRRDAQLARRHHRDLEESRQKLQALYALSPLAIVLNRMHDGQFLEANQALCQLTGYSLEELHGLSYWDLTPEEYADDEASLLERLRTEGHYGPYEKEYFHRDGHRVPVLLNGVRFEDTHGESMIWSIIQDMSEYRRIQQMKDEFVSTVSHELRTPLTSIAGSLDLIVGGALGEVPPAMKEMLAIARRNGLRLTHLINDLLDVEKLATGKMHLQLAPRGVRGLLEEALENQQGYARRFDVALHLDGEGDAAIEVDALRFDQVMANLLSNAIKFSPAGGTVTVAYALEDDTVRVRVIDRGKGIPVSFHGRIFQRFSQADGSDSRSQGGSGLGLVICKQLVEHMGGRIGFDTRDNAGTSFWFTLPRVPSEAESVSLAPPKGEDAAGEAAVTVLIVEDDADVARLLGVTLLNAGYRSDWAASLVEARQRLETRSYDAITLDLALPDGNGIELLRDLRGTPETEHLPVLVISAYCDRRRLQIGGGVAEASWLTKPIDEPSLLAALSSLLRPRDDGSRPRVLHVEDDRDLVRVVAEIGRDLADFDAATTLAQARWWLERRQYDLVLLDLGLPDGHGLALCETLECRGTPPPIVVMSAQELSPEQHRQVAAVLAKAHTTSEQLVEVLRRMLSATP